MSLTPAELANEVLVAPRHPSARLPDTEVIARDDWFQIRTPSIKGGGLNEVSLAVLAPDDVDAAITRTLATFEGIRFRWSVMPDSRPLDLPARLAARGFVRSETRAMYRAATPLEDVPGVTVERERDGVRFTDVLARGWGMDPAPLFALHDAMLRGGKTALFVASLDGVPVGAAGMVFHERSAYLLGGVVLEAARKRGVYRALVAQRMKVAREAGLELITVHANAATSGPLLEKLGFVDLVRYPNFSR